MTDTTKVDLSREAVEAMSRLEALSGTPYEMPHVVATLRALLDAKEAAERERDAWKGRAEHWHQAYTEARASAAAAWEAGREAGADKAERSLGGFMARVIRALTNPDPSATEALRRVKEAVWDEGREYGLAHGKDDWPDKANPYRQPKEAAHG